ncbi:MAG: sulfotransferase [Proteobacteria bacterium]|nr:sulfotransferase [Pseudomonadota bacterium]
MTPAEADRELAAALERHKNGDLEFAYRAYLQVLKQHPDHPTALHYLGLVAQQTGHVLEAARLLRRSIQLNPGDPRTYNHLGQVLFQQDDLDEAIQLLRRGLEVDPRHVDTLNSLANVLKKQGELQQAMDVYRQVLDIDPDSVPALYNLANALKQAGDPKQAVGLFRRALQSDPTHAPSRLNLAVLLEQQGEFAPAIEQYRALLERNPDHGRALSGLLAIRSLEPDPQWLEAAERLLAGRTLESEEQVKLHTGLGKQYDRMRNYERAFHHFAAANTVLRRRGAPFDVEQVRDLFERLIRVFSVEYFANLTAGGSPSRRPIFIVGMPRSGTTLTEQILASHPQIGGAGELRSISDMSNSMSRAYPECVTGLSPAERLTLGERHLASLTQHAGAQALHVTDKLPVNFIHLGLIATVLPGARVIHCRRNPLDVGLSCFIEHFDMKNDFTHDLHNFGEYFIQYHCLMQHWRRVLPIPMYELHYEQLVADQEGETRRLLEFVGVPWYEGCLEFQATERTVMTPSRWQVRQKIYSQSVGRWRNYESHLQSLQRLLIEQGIGLGETA